MLRAPTNIQESPKQVSGFPSPAQSYSEAPLDINLLLIEHPAATEIFEFLAQGGEIFGINAGDLLVIDRSVIPRPGDLIIKERDYGRFITRYQKRSSAQNIAEPSRILGTVTWLIKKA